MRIPYRSETDARSLRSRTPVVSGEAFGAGVGRAIQSVGQEISRAGAIGLDIASKEIDRKNREQDAINVANNDYTSRSLDLRNEADENATDHARTVSEDYDAWVDETADAIEDPNRRAAYRSHQIRRKESWVSRAAAWEGATSAKNTENNINSGLTSLNNRVKADPLSYLTVLQDGNALIDSRPVNATAKGEMKQQWRYDTAKSRFDSMISDATTSGEIEAIHEDLTDTSGRGINWTKEMASKDYEITLEKLKATKARIGGATDSFARAAIKTVEERNDAMAAMSLEELKASQNAVKQSDSPALIEGIARATADQNLLRTYSKSTREYLSGEIDRIDGVLASAAKGKPLQGPGVAPEQVMFEDNEMRKRILDNMNKELKDDPMAYTSRSGLFTVNDLSDEDGYKHRGAAAKATADYHSIPLSNMKPLTVLEVASHRKMIEEGSIDEQLEMMSNFQAMGVDMGMAALKQVGESDPVFWRAGALYSSGHQDTAAEVMRGRKIISDNPNLISQMGASQRKIDKAFVSGTGRALDGLNPGDRQAVQDASFAHSVSVSKDKGFSSSAYAVSINAVLDGNSEYKSIDEVNGSKTLLPTGMSASMMEKSLVAMDVQDYMRLSDHGAPPRYSDGMIVDPKHLASTITMRAIGEDKYHLEFDDGSKVIVGLSEDGRAIPYIFAPLKDKKINEDILDAETRDAGFIQEKETKTTETKPVTKKDVIGMVRPAVPKHISSANHIKGVVWAIAPTVRRLVNEEGIEPEKVKEVIKGYYARLKGEDMTSYDDMRMLLENLSSR